MERFEPLIIIPALNEEHSIGTILSQIPENYNVLVVDDGSTDNTAEIVTFCGAKLVKHISNKGYAAAIHSGFEYAQAHDYTHVITFDADGEHNPESLQFVIDHLRQAPASLVIGIRTNRRRISEHVAAFICKIIWGIDDIFCGLKAYPIDIWLRYSFFENYDSCGTQLFLLGAKNGRKVMQVNIDGKKRANQSRFDTHLKAHIRILKQIYFILFIK